MSVDDTIALEEQIEARCVWLMHRRTPRADGGVAWLEDAPRKPQQ